MRPALRLPHALTALLLASTVGSSWGQLSAEAVKAGLVFNFVKFAEWPAAVLPPGAPLHLCTVGPRDPTIAALDALQDKIAQGHAVSLRAATPREGFKGCHVVAVSAGLNPPLADTVRQAHAAGALTVSDAPGFTEAGGIVGFFAEGDHIRFDINLDSTYKADVRISLQVLRLARNVRK